SSPRTTSSASSSRQRVWMPIASSSRRMCSTSEMCGTLRSTYRPVASTQAAMSLSTEFFAPRMTTSPESGPEGRTIRRDTCSSMSATARTAVRAGPGSVPAPRGASGGGSGRTMARIHTVGECDADELARRLVPRDDVLVLEREVACAGDGPREGTPGPCGSATFEAEHGPFRRYERTLDWSPGTDGRLRVEQVVEFVPAIPYWSPLFVPLLKRVLPRGPAPGTTPWWS